MLHDENVWICDTGASNHVTWCNKGAINLCDIQMLSLGHTGEAVGTTAVINIPGMFMPTPGELGIIAVVRECQYNKVHSFTLLSLSRLLHCNGSKITCYNEKVLVL